MVELLGLRLEAINPMDVLELYTKVVKRLGRGLWGESNGVCVCA